MTYEACVRGIAEKAPKGKWVKIGASETDHQSSAATGCNRFYVFISFWTKNIRRDFLDGIVSVEVSDDYVALERRLCAAEQMVSDNSQMTDDLRQQILGMPEVPQNFPDQFHHSSDLDTEQQRAVYMLLHSSFCLIDVRVVVVLVSQPT